MLVPKFKPTSKQFKVPKIKTIKSILTKMLSKTNSQPLLMLSLEDKLGLKLKNITKLAKLY